MNDRLYQSTFMAVKACRHGAMIYNLNDTCLGKCLDLYGEWAEVEMKFLSQFIQPGDIVLDVGAYIGTHSVFFSQQVGKDGIVVAFEPQRLAYHTLCGNLAINGITNVIALQRVVASKAGVAGLYLYDPSYPANYAMRRVVDYETDGEQVPIITIDGLVPGGLKKCNLIKVDVEGMEANVLEGAQETIERLKPTLFVENNQADKSHGLLSRIEAIGYVAFWDFSPRFNPANFFGNPINVDANEINGHANPPEANMLCLHRDRVAEWRDRGCLEGLSAVDGLNDDHHQAWQRFTEKKHDPPTLARTVAPRR